MLSQRQEGKSNTFANLFVLNVLPHEKHMTPITFHCTMLSSSTTVVTTCLSSHVLCVVVQVNPQVTLWHVPSLSRRGMLVQIAETLICTGEAWDISSLACSSLFNLSCIESTINQKTSQCVYVLEI